MFSSTERTTRRTRDATNDYSAGANMNPNQTYGEHPASGPAPSTAGFHKHDILNKLDPRVDSTMDHQPVAAMVATEGTYDHGGPHNSRVANALDPRVDSARDASYHHSGSLGESMHGAAGPSSLSSAAAAATGSHHAYGNRQHHILPEDTYGPSQPSRLANTLDPHVDPNHNNRMNNPNSNVPLPHPHDDHRARHGFHHGVDVATNASTVTAAGTGHGFGAAGGSHGSHGHGNNQHLPSTQPHGTSASGHKDGRGYHDMSGNVSQGILPNTAGPHKSDLLNKLDPRGGHAGY